MQEKKEPDSDATLAIINSLGPGPKCSCSKSKCLKLYCEFFSKGLHCGTECGC